MRKRFDQASLTPPETSARWSASTGCARKPMRKVGLMAYSECAL
jgi:hypothetical protein